MTRVFGREWWMGRAMRGVLGAIDFLFAFVLYRLAMPRAYPAAVDHELYGVIGVVFAFLVAEIGAVESLLREQSRDDGCDCEECERERNA